MTLRILVSSIVLGLLAMVAVPSVIAEDGDVAADVAAVAQEDTVVAERVRSAISQIRAYQQVFVSVNGGVVSLRGIVLELEDVLRAEELVSKVDGVVSVNNLLEVETSIEERITPALERFEKRLDQFVSVLPLFGIGLAIFFVIATIGFLIARLKNPWNAIAPNRFIADLLRQFVRIAFVLLGLVLALDILGATAILGTILGAAGILGLAIGFAVRDTVENYIASILLSFRQPFRPRDYVKIGDYAGFVISLTARATVLLTVDGNHVRIPNATVFKGEITNYSLNPDRRFDFRLGVETEDLQLAISLGLEVIRGLSFVLDEPEPEGWIDDIGDSSMILWFGAWIDQRESSLAKARSEAIRKVKLTFEKEGIGLPEPIYRLRFDDRSGTVQAIDQQALPSESSTVKRSTAKFTDDSEQDVSPNREIERKVAEESGRSDNDLLDQEAPQELDSRGPP